MHLVHKIVMVGLLTDKEIGKLEDASLLYFEVGAG